ncbi:MAG: hypothetical protein L3J39_13305 [Verrucomicrobiales bacterium]|nr:hypothetical protein [Verrucomicrobiales bacterium]
MKPKNPSTRALVQLILLFCLIAFPAFAEKKAESTKVNTSISNDGTGSIMIEAHGVLPKPKVFYTATANATAQVGAEYIEQNIPLNIKVIQGEAQILSLGLNGSGEVDEVTGDNLLSWSIRQEGKRRFLDLRIKKGSKAIKALVKTRSAKLKLPATVELTHLTPGKAIAFNSNVTIKYTSGITGTVTTLKGFRPLNANKLFSDAPSSSFHTTTGGSISLSLNRGDATPAPVELLDTQLTGKLHPNGKSVQFQLNSTAQISQANAEITILSGDAALSQVADNPNYHIQLATQNDHTLYKLIFPKAGTFPVKLDFVAKVISPNANSHRMDFTIAASAVVPITLSGLHADLEFFADKTSVVPLYENKTWLGFLPATGRAHLR